MGRTGGGGPDGGGDARKHMVFLRVQVKRANGCAVVAMFFVGTATRFDSPTIRKYSFAFGVALFAFVAVRTALLPVAV